METTTKLTKSISLDYLPMALWTQILSFLPVKSLFVLQSVCKFFFAIINDSYFVSLHIRNFRPNHNETRILTLKSDDTELRICCNATGPVDAEFVYRGGCELFDVGLPGCTEKWIEKDSIFYDRWFVSGSIDGLILMAGDDEVVLWNPSIRKFRRIPHPCPSNPLSYYYSIRLGLGYDASCKDYKVFAIIDPILNNILENAKIEHDAVGFHIYSVKTRSWTKGELPDFRHKRVASQIVSFKGGLVWIEGVKSSDGYYHQLVRFDFKTNTFAYSWMPYPIKNNLWVESRLVMIDGVSSLGVWGLDSRNLVSLWVMDETHNSSWIKMYGFGQGILRVGCYRDEEMIWEYWTKGAKPKVSLYDDNEEDVSSFPPLYYMGVYVESLVLLLD